MCWLRGVYTGVENPGSSLLSLITPFMDYLQYMNCGRKAVRSYLGQFEPFGTASPKPISLWGTWPSLQGLKRKAPSAAQCPERLCAKSADGRFTNGKPKKLKKSQAYSMEFGRVIAARLQQQFAGERQTRFMDDYDCWPAAKKVLEEDIFPTLTEEEKEQASRMFDIYEDSPFYVGHRTNLKWAKTGSFFATTASPHPETKIHGPD